MFIAYYLCVYLYYTNLSEINIFVLISINWNNSFNKFLFVNLAKIIAGSCCMKNRDGSRTAATCKVERFVIIVNGFQPLTMITKHASLDVAAVLDAPLKNSLIFWMNCFKSWTFCIALTHLSRDRAYSIRVLYRTEQSIL